MTAQRSFVENNFLENIDLFHIGKLFILEKDLNV